MLTMLLKQLNVDEKVQFVRLNVCTTVCSSAVLVFGGTRAIKVYIVTTTEATVVVLRFDVLESNCVPSIAHSLSDVVFGEFALGEHSLPPHIEEGIIERAQTFGCCRWHADDLRQLLTAPVVELLQDLRLSVNGSTIDDQTEGIPVQGASRLSKKILNVLMQHSFVDPLRPLIGCIDDGWQHFLAAAARDHVVSRCIGGCISDLNVHGLTWKHDGVCRGITQALVSLVEEENLALVNSLKLATDLGYLRTHG
jgi:hypothetical protein